MDFLIVGAGKMARAIGTRIVAGEHTARIIDRDEQRATALAAELNGDITGDAFTGPGAEQIVVLAVPYPATLQLATEWSERLAGHIVVDISNPVRPDLDGLTTPPESSAAEQVAAAAPGARVVKAFNTTFAGPLTSDVSLDVFIAGDDPEARETIGQLATDGGLRGIDVGALRHARALEGFQLLHMKVQEQIGGGWGTALDFSLAM
jgi:predicted dinucleotide-binding enzyme